MSIHNIGFYEDLTKIIFELSSNIIKYAPYFFFCIMRKLSLGCPTRFATNLAVQPLKIVRGLKFWISEVEELYKYSRRKKVRI